MYDIFNILAGIFFLATFASIIYIVVKAIKKQFTKSLLLLPVVLFVIYLVICAVAPEEPKDSSESKQSESVVESSAETFLAEIETESTTANSAEESSEEETSTENETISEPHIYDNAQIKDVMNGLRTEKIGEYSVIEINSSEVTEETLADWYYNYVSVNDFNWCMILYSDKSDNSGVYALVGMVQKDIFFNVDEYGEYSVGDSSNATLYFPSGDGKTLEIFEEE